MRGLSAQQSMLHDQLCNEKAAYSYQQIASSASSSSSDGNASDAPSISSTRRLVKSYKRSCIIALISTCVLLLSASGIFVLIATVLGMLRWVPYFDAEAINNAGMQRPQLSLTSSNTSTSSINNSNLVLHDYNQPSALSVDDLELLILCPMKNAESDLARFFQLLDQLAHPKSKTSLGFLIGDEDDQTAQVLLDLVEERQNKPESFKKATILRKDFSLDLPSTASRHAYWLQPARRAVMAKARTYLLTATLEPSINWVLWLDADIVEYSPTLFSDLLLLGNAGSEASEASRQQLSLPQSSPPYNDIIIPNVLRRLEDGSLLPYDMNNWAETADSLKMKSKLRADTLLVEGNIWQNTHRTHLGDLYTPYGDKPDVFSCGQDPTSDGRFDASSDAWIGRNISLTGVGGVAALVRADVHRMGAIFPAWIFDHQLETEGFARLAKTLGARIIGLANYIVLHRT